MSTAFRIPGYKSVCTAEGCLEDSEAVVFWSRNSKLPSVMLRCKYNHAAWARMALPRFLSDEERGGVVQRALAIMQSDAPEDEKENYASVFEQLTRNL